MSDKSKPQSKFRNKMPSAMRTGVYSTISVLPGEDQSAYDRLHRDVFEELQPVGGLEEDQVKSIARLTWRKRNLATVHIAVVAQERMKAASQQYIGSPDFSMATQIPEEIIEAKIESVRKEFKGAYDFDVAGIEISLDTLTRDLDTEERIDGLIDRCLKRLLYLRAAKSLSTGTQVQPAKRIARPSDAA